MTPQDTALLIENHGLAVVIAIVVIVLAYKYFANLIKSQKNTLDEVINTLSEVNNTIKKGYSKTEDFYLMVKLRGKYTILEYKWQIIKYILDEHIGEIFKMIELEMRNYIDTSSNKTIEILNRRASPEDIQEMVDLINNTLVEVTRIIEPILKELCKQELSIEEKLNIVRTIENHFNKIENEFLCKFNKK